MKTLVTSFLALTTCISAAQTKVTESVSVTNQLLLELDFAFADDITIKTWDKPEVYVEVSVSINDGEYDHIFSLNKMVNERMIFIAMDKDMWKQIDRKNNNCNFESELNYTVYLPKNLELEAETISGNFTLEPYGQETRLKTISGDIDITVKPNMGLDFKAKTISGEIYSDLDIEYPDGKDGLRQVVGMNVKGRVYRGGTLFNFETISGDIFLRKG